MKRLKRGIDWTAAALDLIGSLRRRNFGRVLICWADLRRKGSGQA